MKIEDNLLAVTNCMFRDRQNWKFVSDEQKEKYFFIVNRLLSKKFTEISQLLNHKSINGVVGMDLIFKFMENKAYPSWFWTKSEKVKDSDNKDDFSKIRKTFQISESETEFLFKYFPDEIKEELAYYKKLEKN